MADPSRKSGSEADPDDASPEAAAPPEVAVPEHAAAQIGTSFPEAATETIAALLHLVRLMGGELVLNVSGGETERFERAVRSKIQQFPSPTSNPAARKSGLAFATHLVEQVLTQLRAQAEVKRSLAKGKPARRQETPAASADADADAAAAIPPKFLN
jgi:hypothetical protein